jgi:hypothetical protein
MMETLMSNSIAQINQHQSLAQVDKLWLMALANAQQDKASLMDNAKHHQHQLVHLIKSLLVVNAYALMETQLLMDHAQLQQLQQHQHQLVSKETDVLSNKRMIPPTERESTNAHHSITVLLNKLVKVITHCAQEMNRVVLMIGRAQAELHSVHYTHVFLRNIAEFKMPLIQVTTMMELPMIILPTSHVLVLPLQLNQLVKLDKSWLMVPVNALMDNPS